MLTFHLSSIARSLMPAIEQRLAKLTNEQKAEAMTSLCNLLYDRIRDLEDDTEICNGCELPENRCVCRGHE